MNTDERAYFDKHRDASLFQHDKENIRQVGAVACPYPLIFGRPQGIAPTVAKTICG